MPTRKPRIGVAVEPFLARSALYASLSKEPRLQPVLIAPGGPVAGQGLEPLDAVVVSEPVALHASVTVTFVQSSATIELSRGDVRHQHPFRGVRQLIDLLVQELSSNKTEEGASDKPESPVRGPR